jgi:general secretion pathway protein D
MLGSTSKSVLKYFLLFLMSAGFCLAADPGVAALARAADKARNSGQVVRAYLLYAEAAARDPRNESYRENRNALKPLADLLSKAGVQSVPNRAELLASVTPEGEQRPLDRLTAEEQQKQSELQPPPKLDVTASRHDFHLRGEGKKVFDTVTQAYGVGLVFDPQFQPQPNVQFDVQDVDFKTAMKALTAATNTFIFPISNHAIFVATDTLQKREEYEPQISMTVPLPNTTDPKEVTEAANAVRLIFNLRHVSYDSSGRSIIIRDRLSRARSAQVLLESLIHPRAQVALEVQILTLDHQSTLHYGLSLPTSFPIVNLGGLNSKQIITSIPQGFVNFLTFGGGATLFGIGLTDAQAFAMASKAWTRNIYDATVVVSSGETANLHIGDKYPIATSLYTGASQLPSPLYAPAPEIQQVDLGVVLKLKPQLHADGDVSLDVEAQYQALGTLTFNTVPEILDREFKGSVRLHVGQWAVLAGLDTQTSTESHTGLPGLSEVPGLREVLSEVNRSHMNSQTLVLLKPHVLRDNPLIDGPEYYYGSDFGRKVLL